ncbi:hypothetical protein GZ77_06450 [Endozoicomonas montiporae]|uniref:Uncharacterized protein n=2 Tax=Endozoicomonas montiporae TaxID=1027273 RepID=A0A081NCC3_9GAMM|nr:hypothetical protein [Endozoicomonas montiporae]AMO56427.1 hypothetical protein EZMO1_2329 [Endozoicomonas montiporae CL-33]KEQ16096.1 hypothetical protein GZ77_06450 [Endozoicomonas montiporae]
MNVQSLDTLVRELYDTVLLESSKVLRNAKRFSIQVLKEEDNPSYEQIADDLLFICELLDALINHDRIKDDEYTENHWTLSRAKDYARFVQDVAKAIQAGDETRIKALTTQADRWSFL